MPPRVAIGKDYGVNVMPEVDVFDNATSMSLYANSANLIDLNGRVRASTS